MKKAFFSLTAILLLLSTKLVFAEERVYIDSQIFTVTNNITDSGSGLNQMSFSVDNQLTWSTPELFTVKKSLTLPNFDEGKHCIYGKFSDIVENWSLPIEACAWVDTTPPGGPIIIEGLTINIEVNVN
jgi:hypothetical protein